MLKKILDAVLQRKDSAKAKIDIEKLHRDNMHFVMMSQALLGVISPNFRMISIDFTKPCWKIVFILEKDFALDHEEIEDFKTEFDALLGYDQEYYVELRITDSQLSWPEPAVRVVYRRREKSHYTYWVSRLMLKSGVLVTEKDMPQNQNILREVFLEVGNEITIEYQGKKMLTRIGWINIRNESDPFNPSMNHIRVEEI